MSTHANAKSANTNVNYAISDEPPTETEWVNHHVKHCRHPRTGVELEELRELRSPDQERKALPVASDEKGALSIARWRKR